MSDGTEATFTASEVESIHQRMIEAEQAVLRLDIAAKYGINAEDSATLLTATDETGLTAQARRLSQMGNMRRTEVGRAKSEVDIFTGRLFGPAQGKYFE